MLNRWNRKAAQAWARADRLPRKPVWVEEETYKSGVEPAHWEFQGRRHGQIGRKRRRHFEEGFRWTHKILRLAGLA